MSQPNLIDLVREYCAKRVQLKEDTCQNKPCFILSGYAYPKDSVTPFKIYNKDDEYYNLESILYLLSKKDEKHAKYVKDAASVQIRAITQADKREIMEYLTGDKTEVPSNYNQHLPPAIPITFERIRTEEPKEPAAKKIKLEPRVEKEVTISIKKEPTEEENTPLRQLNNDLTIDKIAELKRKKMLNQKKRIAPIREEINLEDLSHYEAEPVEKKKTNSSFTIKVYATLDNCMEALTVDFSQILDIIESVKNSERNSFVLRKAGYVPARNEPIAAPVVQRYDRYDQAPVPIKDERLNFSEGTFIGKNILTAANQEAAPKKRHGSNEAIPLRPPPPPPRKRTNKTPIVIIPPSNGMTGTLINRHNVRDILQNMTYSTIESKKDAVRKESADIQILRRKGGMIVPYKIVENATILTPEQWDRVVAIFVMGPTWQFKGWKWNGNPVDIFSQVPAFHLYYEDLEIDKNVAKWNVTAIPISRVKRHLDRARLGKIWETVDRFVLKHKSHLRA